MLGQPRSCACSGVPVVASLLQTRVAWLVLRRAHGRHSHVLPVQAMNELVEEIKSGDGNFPARRTDRIVFIVRMAEDAEDGSPQFMRVPFDIRTTGADCRHLMAESFHKLFKTVGLPSTFNWGNEFWNKKLEAATYVSKEEYYQHREAQAEYERQGRQRQ